MHRVLRLVLTCLFVLSFGWIFEAYGLEALLLFVLAALGWTLLPKQLGMQAAMLYWLLLLFHPLSIYVGLLEGTRLSVPAGSLGLWGVEQLGYIVASLFLWNVWLGHDLRALAWGACCLLVLLSGVPIIVKLLVSVYLAIWLSRLWGCMTGLGHVAHILVLVVSLLLLWDIGAARL